MHQSFVATAPPHRVDNSRVNPGKVQSNDYSIIPAVQWKCQGCDSLKVDRTFGLIRNPLAK